MAEENNWESYFYKNENILINNLNIHDEKELKKIEYEIVAKKNTILCLSEIEEKFDIEHLKKIHKFLFEDIYPFAGEFRKVNMGKDERASFTDYRLIEQNINDILKDLDDKIIKKAYSKFFYADSLSKIYYLLLEIHPFREGNGRTIREFLREYVEVKNKYIENYEYTLDFNLSKEDKNYLEMATKSGINAYLVTIFDKMLKVKEKEKKYKL